MKSVHLKEGVPMLITMTLVFLYWLLVHALFYWTSAHWLNVYITAFLAFLYVPSYMDGKEHTGERQWRALREWRGWRRFSPVVSHFANQRDLNAVDHRSMRLYIMVRGKTLNGSLWGIGLHGGTLSPFAERLHYVVPPLLLAVPLLRDVLLWTGAVTWHPKRLPLTDLILQLVRSNRSVCYHCSVDMELFRFALEEKMQIVPVVLQNEQQYYYVADWPRLHGWTQKYLGYPWPQLVWPRRNRPAELEQVFGPILHCTDRYTNAEHLSKSFAESVKNLSCPDLEEQEELFQVTESF
jgi:hypothetical protein